MTDKIFQRDPYRRQEEARVVRIEERGVILDRTIFAPDAGGQPSDTGTLAGLPIRKAEEQGDEILHILENPQQLQELQEGSRVSMEINWKRRFDHMQNHLGEHLLSGVFKSLYGLDNKGFHLGDEEGTFDLDTPSLTEEMLMTAEKKVNEAVYQGIPVHIIFAEDREEAAQYPLRKALTVEKDILIVEVPGVDCVACCCPHPRSTAEIGIVKIIGTEKYKGMTRVRFLCGMRALMDYQQKHQVMDTLCEKYSADPYTLTEKMQKVEEKQERIRRESNSFRTAVARDVANRCAQQEDEIIMGEYDPADMALLRDAAEHLTTLTDRPFILQAGASGSVILSRGKKESIHCGNLVKQYAAEYGGRGGGRDIQAQVTFQDENGRHRFVECAAKIMKEGGSLQ